MNLPARMDQAGIIDSDDSNIEQARGCKSTGIVKTGMMERTERQVVAVLEDGTLDRAHTTTSVGNSEFLCGGPHTAAALGHNLGRYLIRHIGSKGTGTLAIAEHVHTRENPHDGTAPATPRTPRPSHQENRR